MPRTAKIKSTDGIEHVMLRGINRQNIFEEKDNEKFIGTLEKCNEISEFEIYAYCLMVNTYIY